MAVHAAMVDSVDQGIGRILKKLKETGEFENTLILFFSDNGASPERGYPPGFDRNGHKRDGTAVDYKAKKNLGSEDTYPYLGRSWSNAVNTPFRYWKKESYEGGIHTPMIVHWPKGLKTKEGSITHQLTHVIDIMPTCLEMAGAEYPKEFKGNKIVPMDGRSLLPILKGETLSDYRTLFFEHVGGKALRSGDWKISALKGKPWQLFNIAKDRTESVDLKDQYPEKLQDLAKLWEAKAKEFGISTAAGKKKKKRK